VGVAVGVGVGVADGDGDGESLAEGVGVRDASGEAEAVGVDAGAGLTAAVGVHPPSTIASVMMGNLPTIRRNGVPTGIQVGRGESLRACTRGRAREKLLPYAGGI
jgi:hypothetical protein